MSSLRNGVVGVSGEYEPMDIKSELGRSGRLNRGDKNDGDDCDCGASFGSCTDIVLGDFEVFLMTSGDSNG